MELLLNEIETAKRKLGLQIKEEAALTSEMVVKKSQYLDRLIKRFYELQYNHR